MDEIELKKFEPFHHDILLKNGEYTAPDTYRIRFFNNAFLPSLLNFFGGSFEGKSVLDIGCNCGGFSFLANQHGATEVTGIDVRQDHIDQANALATYFKLQNMHFFAKDINSFFVENETKSYDLIFLMGLMYHLANPIETFSKISQLAAKHIVIDSHVHYSSDPTREDMPMWWMLSDTDMGETSDLNPLYNDELMNEYLSLEASTGVDYSTLSDYYHPTAHTLRDLKISEKMFTDPNAPGPSQNSVRSSLEFPFSLVPNRRALIKLVRAYGFHNVCEIIPPRIAEPRYLKRYRTVLIASK